MALLSKTFVNFVEAGFADHPKVIGAGEDAMQVLTRAEQITMLAGILRNADKRDRDTGLELICALAVYAKPRWNAPRDEIPALSLFNAIVRASKRRRFAA